MTIKGKKLAWIDLDFEKNLNQMFPYKKSMCAKTKELNIVLKNLMYYPHLKKK